MESSQIKAGHHIQADVLNTYMRESLAQHIGAFFIVSPFQYFVHKDSVSNAGILLWITINCAYLIALTFTYWRYRVVKNQISISLATSPIWLYTLILTAFPWIFMHGADEDKFIVLIVQFLALAAISAYAFGYFFRLMSLYLLLPMASLLMRVVFSEIDSKVILSGVIIWMTLSSIIFFKVLNKKLINTIKLQSENIQARIQAENANLAKSKFFAAASHDIRQPLQAINFFLEALNHQSKEHLDQKLYRSLESSVESMSGLLNNLLDISKLDGKAIEAAPRSFYLHSMISRLTNDVMPIAQSKSVSLRSLYDNQVAFADPVLLERVIKNLLANAVEYTHEGSVTLRITETTHHSLIISVEDTGVGINPEDQQEIFTEFHQIENPERDPDKGLGLGLAIVKRLCDLQHWPLQLQSKPGSGSIFSIEVPTGHANEVKAERAANGIHDFNGVRVVVIDDHKDIRTSLTELLGKWGVDARAYESGVQACSQLKSEKSWLPHLIISDYRLRDNETGDQAITMIQKLFDRDIEGVIITGDTAPERIKEAEVSGYVVIHKPVKPAMLKAYLLQYFKNHINLPDINDGLHS